MRFLVENSLSPRLADALRQRGHDAAHVRELGLAPAPDDVIFELAARESRVIIAQDTDFGTILALRAEKRPSVLLFRCQAKSTEAILRLLDKNLPAAQESLDAGAVVVVEDTRIRIRSLPIVGE